MKINKAENKFSGKAIIIYGIKVYSKVNSLKYVDVCSKNEIKILGCDGFFISKNKTQPSQADSIEFDSNETILNRCKLTSSFINSRDSSIHYEITCE